MKLEEFGERINRDRPVSDSAGNVLKIGDEVQVLESSSLIGLWGEILEVVDLAHVWDDDTGPAPVVIVNVWDSWDVYMDPTNLLRWKYVNMLDSAQESV